jgi:proto-oncogene tyrosine-protein kinase ROS
MYMIQIAVKNYYSEPLEHLPLGKEIQGQTKSGGELWAAVGF